MAVTLCLQKLSSAQCLAALAPTSLAILSCLHTQHCNQLGGRHAGPSVPPRMKVGPGLQVVFLAFTLLLCSVHTARGWSEHSLSLPRRNCLPSNSRPFVFLHQRKTGGSSLRQEILFAGLRYAASTHWADLRFRVRARWQALGTPCLCCVCCRAQLSAAVACLTGTCFMHSEPEWPDATVSA